MEFKIMLYFNHWSFFLDPLLFVFQIKKLKAFSGDVAKLSLADSFLHCLLQVPK